MTDPNQTLGGHKLFAKPLRGEASNSKCLSAVCRPSLIGPNKSLITRRKFPVRKTVENRLTDGIYVHNCLFERSNAAESRNFPS